MTPAHQSKRSTLGLLGTAITGAAQHGEKPTNGEMISTRGWTYLLQDGKWTKNLSVAEMKQQDTTVRLRQRPAARRRPVSR